MISGREPITVPACVDLSDGYTAKAEFAVLHLAARKTPLEERQAEGSYDGGASGEPVSLERIYKHAFKACRRAPQTHLLPMRLRSQSAKLHCHPHTLWSPFEEAKERFQARVRGVLTLYVKRLIDLPAALFGA